MNRVRRRGVALILALWLLVALGAIGSIVVRDARSSTSLALNARAGLIARASAESGIEVLVASIQDTLAVLPFGMERRAWLNGLEDATGTGDTLVFGEGRVAWAVLDVNARFDLNAATRQTLVMFFSQFTTPSQSESIARAIRDHIGGAPAGMHSLIPDQALRLARPLRSLDAVRAERLMPDDIFDRVAPYLTVDGDGLVNARSAPEVVLAAAAGELRAEPTRLLLVSRGWMASHPLTHEIQAVYEVQVDRLVLVRLRERVL